MCRQQHGAWFRLLVHRGGIPPRQNFSKIHRSDYPPLSPLDQRLQLPNKRKIFDIYASTLLMYTVAGPNPNSRGGGQLPNPNECNSTLTSATREETLTPNEWN